MHPKVHLQPQVYYVNILARGNLHNNEATIMLVQISLKALNTTSYFYFYSHLRKYPTIKKYR